MDAPPLTSAQAAEWTSRLSPALFRPLVAGPWVVTIIALVVFWSSPSSFTVADLQAPGYSVTAVLQGATVASAGLVVWRPSAGVWLAATLAALNLLDPASDSMHVWLAAVAVVFAVLGVTDVAAAARQRVAARAWGKVVVPDIGDATRREALRRRRPALAAVGVCALLTAFGSWLWHHDSSSAERFRADSVVAVGTVVAVDGTDAYWADVMVGEVRHRVATDLHDVAVGDEVELRYARHGDRAELTDQAFDPTGALVLLGAAALGAAGILLLELGRRRQIVRLLDHGGVAVRVGVSPWSDDALLAVPAPVPGAPPATSPVVARLLLRTGPDRPGAASDLDGRDADDLATDGRATDDVPVEHVPDDELLRAAASIGEDTDDGDDEHDTTAVVVGLHAYGDLPLVHVDGTWWWTARGATDDRRALQPWRRVDGAGRDPRAGQPRRVPGQVQPTGPVGSDSRAGAPESRIVPDAGRGAGALAGVRSWGTHVPTPVAIVTGLLLAPAAWWLFGDDGPGWWGAIVATMGAANIGSLWTGSTRARLRIVDDGIWVTGELLDEHVPWTRVVRTICDDRALVVRLVDDALLLPVAPGQTGPGLLREAPDAASAVRLLEEARLSSGAAPTGLPVSGVRRRVRNARRRPSAALVGGVVWGAAVLLPAAAALR